MDERAANILDDVVYHAVEPDADALGLGEVLGGSVRYYVKTDYQRIRCLGEHHVARGDSADRGVEQTRPCLIRSELVK